MQPVTVRTIARRLSGFIPGGPQGLLQRFRPVPDQPTLTVEEQRDKLARELRTSAQPHLVNESLNKLERENGYSRLHSYPVFVSMAVDNKCNAQCHFCLYRHDKSVAHKYLTVEQFKKMTWLRFISKLALQTGLNDSLVSPEFPAIFDYIASTYPHIHTHLQTNGIGLKPSLVESMADRLGTIVVSIHAARAETWAQQLQVSPKGFERMMENLGRLAALRTQTPHKPRIIMAFAIQTCNAQEMPEFVERAHAIGADLVRFVHLIPDHLDDAYVKAQSMHYRQAEFDHFMGEAIERAEALGVPMERPPLFSEEQDDGQEAHPEDFIIYKGTIRARKPSDVGPATFRGCDDPWRLLGLTAAGFANFCCKGADPGFFDFDDLDEPGFDRVWNSELAQWWRRTTNVDGGNPLCTLCQGHDNSIPAVSWQRRNIVQRYREDMSVAYGLPNPYPQSEKSGVYDPTSTEFYFCDAEDERRLSVDDVVKQGRG